MLLNKNEKYSVFGGTGFVGSRFCRNFSSKVLIQDRNDRFPKTKNILYLISTVDNYNIFKDIRLDVKTNLSVLCEVLDNCRDQNIVFNFISSWFVYGHCKLPANEQTICNPKGFYSITKKAAEDLLISFCQTYNLKFRIIRLCNVLGKGDKKSSLEKNALSHMIDLMKDNKDVFLYDDGTPTRDILHLNDVCNAIDLICSNGKYNQIFNVSSGRPTKIGDIIFLAKDILNSKSNIINKDAPDFHKIVQTKNFWMDNSRLLELGFKQKYFLNEIVNELCSS